MQYLAEYGLFLAKTGTLVVALLVLAVGLFVIAARGKSGPKTGQVQVTKLNDDYDDMADTLTSAMLSKDALKLEMKERKRSKKAERKAVKADPPHRNRVFVLDFNGDIRASAGSSLREEVTAILTVAKPQDEVMLRLESGGGMVHAYGLAASQLVRFRDRDIRLTVAVDKIAASGGYMMACVADHIITAPFAVLGSIGVVAQLPNFHRLLKKNHVDFEQFTAGQFKRTVTLFGENTDEDRGKFQSDIDEAHELFKNFIAQYRPSVDLARVATGEHWYGTRAVELALADEMSTSDDFLMRMRDHSDLYHVTYEPVRPLAEKLMKGFATAWEKSFGNAGLP